MTMAARAGMGGPQGSLARRVILFLHNRYCVPGGEERVVDDLVWLVREHLGEDAERLERDSAALGRARATVGMLAGGLQPGDVAAAVRRTGARVVHAHNVNPAFGWRALAAAREAGARVVFHLHNYRLVCAVGTCFTRGADCTRCHGRDTLPGIRLACRGDRVEAAVYGASLAAWQRRLAAQVDRFVVPSEAALRRLVELGAPLGESAVAAGTGRPGPPAGRIVVVPHPVRAFAGDSAAESGGHALVASRLAPEKGVHVAIDAARRTGRPLVVVGDGSLRRALRDHARGADVRFFDAAGPDRLAALRREAAVALVPSRSAETFGLAAAYAMAAGAPVVASRIGALPELVDEGGLVPPGDAAALATALEARWGDAEAGTRGLARVRERCAPGKVADALREAYDG
jgi:glycosyltransferase involved in cell wall biosynthesis